MVLLKSCLARSLVLVSFLSATNAAPSTNHVRQPIGDEHGLTPMEILTFLAKGFPSQTSAAWPFAPLEFEIDYLAESLDLIVANAGPPVTPSKTFSQANATQYDILLVPGGPGVRPTSLSPAVLDFIRVQTPGLQYLLGVCTGSWALANAGVLDGKNATTNKGSFTQIKSSTSTSINWIPKARWVVDNTTWTSSGVFAGADMAYAFTRHLVGQDFANKVRNTVELRAAAQDDDEFAEIFGLVD